MFQTCIRPYNLRPSASRVCVSHDKVNSPCTFHTNMSITSAHRGPSRHSLAAMSTIKTLAVPKPSQIISPLFLSFLLIWRFPILLKIPNPSGSRPRLPQIQFIFCTKISFNITYHIIALVCYDVGTTNSSLGCESPARSGTTRRLLPRNIHLRHWSRSVCHHPIRGCGVHAPLFEGFQCPWAQSR